jgi:hypothetical protein
MASNDNNDKIKVEEEAESSVVVRKRMWLSDDNGGNYSSGESKEQTDVEVKTKEEEEMEEVSSEESSVNQLDTSEEKLTTKHGYDLFFNDNGDTSSTASEPHSPEMLSSHVCSDSNDSEDDDNFWM